jgi:hypothetical protein
MVIFIYHVDIYEVFLFEMNDSVEISEINTISVIVMMPFLADADFTGNPCWKQRKYRDYVIGVAPMSLETLDEIPVPKHQQVAIKGLQQHRDKIGANLSMTFSAPLSLDDTQFDELPRSQGQGDSSPMNLDSPEKLTVDSDTEQAKASSWDNADEDETNSNDTESVADSVC